MPPLRASSAFPLALLLGAASAFGFEPYSLWPLTLCWLAALIALLARARGFRQAFGLGWWFALGHFAVGLNWIATAFTFQAAMPAWLGWVAVVLLSLYLALYPALGLACGWALSRMAKGPAPLVLFAAAGWIAGEWLRATAFTGFAWNPLGVVWMEVPGAFALAPLIGTYALSGLFVLLAGFVWLVVIRAGPRPIAIAAAPLLLGLVAAVIRTALPDGAGSAGIAIRVIQPNINQNEKWEEGAEVRNYDRLVRLTGKPGAEPRLILWPEVAVPWYLDENPLARETIAELLGPRDLLMTGAIHFNYDKAGNAVTATNSLFGLTPRAQLIGRYDKAHLVPYGEYLPMRPILSRIGLSRLAPGDMDFEAGPGARGILMPGIGLVGAQICYEIIFSGHVVDAAHRPRFLFNPSNDAWFGRWGPPQHLAQARLRAAEEGMPVIRSTPTGISAVVDAHGRLLSSLPWHTAGAIDARLPPVLPPTPFARIGNGLALATGLFLAVLGFASARRRR
ncbi:apolipoprotein N-acyltransferase [Sphingomonas sp. BIUV-7]|uniref:Apolipoprotein N-acyltransferase n=1 Tax=Sphingomonas natans TaxID=3063330 RepID=A0ABT8Y4M9_9SPHN|nr:apolipoprotein N-acyltransferase [Sphingomonas sp. BIUV-7]MDO6412947.1 apolipoprotein N-acyltransferase [Sphingomonas sp. BIUV-7]